MPGGSGTGSLIPSVVTTLGSTLADVMLDVAKLLGGLRSGKATGGSTTTLVDTTRDEDAEYWTGGTLWIMSGTQIGSCVRIASYVDNTMTFSALSGAIVAGVEYYALPKEFTLDAIRNAIQASMGEVGEYLAIDESLTTDTDDEVYTLPSGVYNIYRVEIASSDDNPYNYQTNYYWKEVNGYLNFMPSKKPGTDGYKIRLWYKKQHASVFDPSDDIDTAIDRNWLKWAAVVHVLRNSIAVKGKDKAISIDLLNQAITKEAEYRNRQVRANMSLSTPDPRLNP
jgi:hypothetical protein